MLATNRRHLVCQFLLASATLLGASRGSAQTSSSCHDRDSKSVGMLIAAMTEVVSRGAGSASAYRESMGIPTMSRNNPDIAPIMEDSLCRKALNILLTSTSLAEAIEVDSRLALVRVGPRYVAMLGWRRTDRLPRVAAFWYFDSVLEKVVGVSPS
jgi:hypothetical protein